MAGSALPVNVDATYVDSGTDATVQLHQQHHDAIHKVVNLFDKDAATLDGQVFVAVGGLYVPRALLSTDIPSVVANAQTGTTYTLVLADAGKGVTLSNASAITLTVPTNASVAYAVNTIITLQQLGAGQVTVVGAGGVTVNGRGGANKSAGQYGVLGLWKTATDTWTLYGDIST